MTYTIDEIRRLEFLNSMNVQLNNCFFGGVLPNDIEELKAYIPEDIEDQWNTMVQSVIASAKQMSMEDLANLKASIPVGFLNYQIFSIQWRKANEVDVRPIESR